MNFPIRICFLGTPAFAADHLKTLLEDPRYLIAGVVTQPDRPAGRKMQLTASSVKLVACENQLEVLTPENLKKDSATFEKIKAWNADIAVVVAFGQILSQEFLDHFPLGAVNIHGSLLPLWRGAAPIQRSIEAGDSWTGVCLQKMVKKLDAGPIIGERRVQLDHLITASELYDKLSILGADLLKNELVLYASGKIIPQTQDETKVTVAHKIEKEESLINWNAAAEKIHNKVRAFTMGPGTYCLFQGRRLKILKTKVVHANETGAVSAIVELNSESCVVQTALGKIALLQVQPESKARLSMAEFLKSCKLKKGDLFV